jgi:hypothetical protein
MTTKSFLIQLSVLDPRSEFIVLAEAQCILSFMASAM